MNIESTGSAQKVPEVTLHFWVMKIAATTLGETGGDALSMSAGLGYLAASGIFAAAFALAVGVQIRARRFNAALYWTAIIATTTLGTTLADFSDRSLGAGYAGGVAVLSGLLLASLGIWFRAMGTVAVASVTSARAEVYYWVTIMFSQTLGTALGDWAADSAGLGYGGAAAVFSAILALIAGAYYFTRVSRPLLFWAAFVTTRPLGAVVGDFLDKPLDAGGLALSRYSASAVLLLFIVACLVLDRRRTAHRG